MKKYVVLCLVLFFSSGCLTVMDTKWAAINAKARNANMVFAVASEEFVKGVGKEVALRQEYEEEFIILSWDDFYRENADDAGKVDVKLVKSKYLEALDDLKKLNESKQRWEVYKNDYLDAIALLRASTISVEASEEQILEAKASAQAYLDTAVGLVGGVAATFLLAP